MTVTSEPDAHYSMLLQHKTVVVAGGNSGIGEAIARAAAAADANVVIDYMTTRQAPNPSSGTFATPAASRSASKRTSPT